LVHINGAAAIIGGHARESDIAMVAEILAEGRDGMRIRRRGEVDNQAKLCAFANGGSRPTPATRRKPTID